MSTLDGLNAACLQRGFTSLARAMKTRFLCCLVAASLLVRSPHSHAALALVDQQNTSTTSVITTGSATGNFLGESFTPSLLTIDAATFSGATIGVSSTITLDLLAGAGYTGTLLASSPDLTLTNTTPQTVEFDFASAAVLVPGDTYTLVLVQTAGDGTNFSFGDGNPYAGGKLYAIDGSSNSSLDLVFAEGIAVPEPSPWALLLGGAGLAVLALRKRAAVA